MLKMHKKIQQMGFTLIELLVVVAIIAMLTAAGFVAFTNAQKSSRDARRQSDVEAVARATEQYATANAGVYPTAATYGALALGATYFPAGNPVDPKNTGANVYTMVSSATGYCVCAGLEQLGKGNATAVAGATCTFGTPAAGAQGYFCLQNQQ